MRALAPTYFRTAASGSLPRGAMCGFQSSFELGRERQRHHYLVLRALGDPFHVVSRVRRWLARHLPK